MAHIVKIEFTDNENYIISEAKFYANDVAICEKMIAKSVPYRFCLLSSYREFLRLKQITDIKKLDIELKRELYNSSLSVQPDRTTLKIRSEICRCLWLLNFVFEKYFV